MNVSKNEIIVIFNTIIGDEIQKETDEMVKEWTEVESMKAFDFYEYFFKKIFFFFFH